MELDELRDPQNLAAPPRLSAWSCRSPPSVRLSDETIDAAARPRPRPTPRRGWPARRRSRRCSTPTRSSSPSLPVRRQRDVGSRHQVTKAASAGS